MELSTVLLVLAPTSLMFALIEVTLGIIAEVLIRMHFEIQKKEPYRISKTRNLDIENS